MSGSELIWRSLHDVGLAGWFGGSLFGTVALRETSDEAESTGWRAFSPWLGGAMATHLVGGAGLLIANRSRVRRQQGVGASTLAKSGLTAAALVLTAVSARDGARLDALRRDDPAEASGDERAAIERRMRITAPMLPMVTGSIIVLGALEGEQQRPAAMVAGWWDSARSSVADKVTQLLPA